MRHRLIYRTPISGAVTAVILAFAFILGPMHLAFAGPLVVGAPVTNADGRIGLCDVLVGAPSADSGPTWAQLAYSAGARTNRWEFRMDRLEAVQGIWDYSATDAVVQNDTAHGLNTEGILIGTPKWAVRPGANAGNGLPRGLHLPITDPGNVWADYVRQAVRRYAGQVAYWEIWNEPDLKFFWTSSPADYYSLLKVSYAVIHTVDPTAKVVMAGMVVPDLHFLTAVLDAAHDDSTSNEAHGYFDIAAWHAYGMAKLVYSNLLHMQSILGNYGYGDAPIWVTEAGFPASNPNGENRQAAYVLQSIAYAFAAGADRVFVYRASDDPTPKTWGVISAQGIPRFAYTTLAVAAQYLSHVQAVTYDPTPDTERFVFYTAKQRISMLWNHGTTDRSLALSAGHAVAQQVDWEGNASSLLATGGQFQVALPGAAYNRGPDPTGSVVGGPPVMILEDNTRPHHLGAPAYIPPVAGLQRRLVLLNDGATPALVEVSVPGIGWEREELQLKPHAVQFVDLGLLGGASYSGLFRVISNATVTSQALSGSNPVPGITPAASWSVSAAPSTLLLSNPTATTVTGQLTAYGYGGKVRARQSLRIASLETVRWSPPPRLRNIAVSLSIQVAGKIVVSGNSGPLTNAVAHPQYVWYTVAPSASHLVMFNQDASSPAHVDVRYVGSTTVKSVHLKLAGHRSYTISTRRARTVVVAASHGISLGYPESASSQSPLSSQASTRTALTASGTTTQVLVYNPATKPAQVDLSVVGRVAGYHISRVIGPSQVYSLQARRPSDAPRGVVVTSDIPVVSTPGS